VTFVTVIAVVAEPERAFAAVNVTLYDRLREVRRPAEGARRMPTAVNEAPVGSGAASGW